ncbi:MAG TPA: GNAT family N-acetyltransferase [Chitinophagaceae bacterium]|nr:GNAT family N-acetyltransferase [Chitinophagaceae bacterium]
MSEGGYAIQQLDFSNYALLVPLMKDCFGMDVTADYFKWKYFDNPAGHCVGFLAIEKTTNTCVAFYGAIPQKYLVNGEKRTLYQACDTMTHTRHRKKSLFPILAQECYKFLKDQNKFFMIGIGGVAQSFPVLKHFGWKIIFNFRIYFKLNFACQFYLFKKYASGKFVSENPIDLLEKFFADQPSSSRINSPRDTGHYKWRINNPNYNYQIVSFRAENAITGFVAYFIQNNKIFLFDFIFNNTRARKALLWYLSKTVVKNNYKGIIAFCQERGLQSRQLKKGGFMSNPFKKGPLSGKSPFLLYGDDAIMTKFSDPDKWSVTAYDYDAV